MSEIVDPMIGLRVIVTLDEEGDIPFLVLPPGRIVRKFTGKDGQPYHQVRLDRAIITPSGIGSQNWTLLNLVIAPVFDGTRLERLLEIDKLAFIAVAVANLLLAVDDDDPLLDFSKVDYFTRGRVQRE